VELDGAVMEGDGDDAAARVDKVAMAVADGDDMAAVHVSEDGGGIFERGLGVGI